MHSVLHFLELFFSVSILTFMKGAFLMSYSYLVSGTHCVDGKTVNFKETVTTSDPIRRGKDMNLFFENPLRELGYSGPLSVTGFTSED